MKPVSHYTSGIIAAVDGRKEIDSLSSLGQESTSFSELETETPCLSGANSSMIAGSEESTAPYLGMKPRRDTGVRSLSDRLMQSLITSGLVRGITHMSIRKQCGAAIRDSALWPLDGGNAGSPNEDC